VSAAYKQTLHQELLCLLRAERDTLRDAQRATQEGLTHEESRAEGDKDMRSTEASYLARGQAERVVALERDVLLVERMAVKSFAEDEPVAVSALVVLEAEDGRRSTVFLAPAGGGTRLDAGRVRVVTPSSPLGQALIGAKRGEEVVLDQGDRELGYEIVELR
jgi:transcription elongation GreA/GreB family factor